MENTQETGNDKYLFQIISADNGQRSEPFITTWDKLHQVFSEGGDEVNQEDYILLVAVMNDKETTIPGNPLMKIKSFIELHTFESEQEAQANG